MNRRLAGAVAVLAAGTLCAVPAHAATKKHPPLKGSYPLTLYPDPTQDVTGQVGTPSGCAKTVPGSYNDRPFKIPAAGKLHLVLDAPSGGAPSTPVGPDWDLWVRDAHGAVDDGSHGPTSHEELTEKYAKATTITIEVCNLTGNTSGTVSYVFTYA